MLGIAGTGFLFKLYLKLFQPPKYWDYFFRNLNTSVYKQIYNTELYTKLKCSTVSNYTIIC